MRGDEAHVVDAFVAWLVSEGWDVEREREHVDVVARRHGKTLYAEVKGRTAAPGLDIDTMFGQILRRMPFDDDADARFAVVVPDHSVRHVARVNDRVLDLLRIEVYAVTGDGEVRAIDRHG